MVGVTGSVVVCGSASFPNMFFKIRFIFRLFNAELVVLMTPSFTFPGVVDVVAPASAVDFRTGPVE